VKLKLDENLSKYLKHDLTQCGHDVLTTADENLLGKPDIDVAAAAKSEERIVFTLDIGFANIQKFPPGTHPGVVLFRPKSMGPKAVQQFIVDFVKATDLTEISQCNVVVEPGRVRIRRFHVVDKG
jgi:predicted nuclease of predicted toxin-antitoxin system